MTRERAKAVLYSTWMPNFTSRKEKIGKEIWVFKNENMAGKCSNAADIRLELLSGFFLLAAVFSFSMEVIQ